MRESQTQNEISKPPGWINGEFWAKSNAAGGANRRGARMMGQWRFQRGQSSIVRASPRDRRFCLVCPVKVVGRDRASSDNSAGARQGAIGDYRERPPKGVYDAHRDAHRRRRLRRGVSDPHGAAWAGSCGRTVLETKRRSVATAPPVCPAARRFSYASYSRFLSKPGIGIGYLPSARCTTGAAESIVS